MKYQRHSALLDLVEHNKIETQEELAAELRKVGFVVTQATVSRDIKELHLIKVPSGTGRYHYAPAESGDNAGFEIRFRTIFRESIIHVDCAGNIVVIKTLTGVASAAGAALDAMRVSDIVGTLAGDDTLFLVMRTPEKAIEFAGEVKKLMK